jgi:hypothetical protein
MINFYASFQELILGLISNHITQSLAQQKERYDACGCASCSARANGINKWLTPRQPIWQPDEEESSEKHPERVALAAHHVWLCHSCLRKVSAPTGRCPYCGTERHLTK